MHMCTYTPAYMHTHIHMDACKNSLSNLLDEVLWVLPPVYEGGHVKDNICPTEGALQNGAIKHRAFEVDNFALLCCFVLL